MNAPGLQTNNCLGFTGYTTFNVGDGVTCYKYISDLVTQADAKARCLQDNAKLVSVNNPETITIVKALATG